MNELLNMGGYGVYVWTAYSLTLIVFGINIWNSVSEKRQVKKIIRQHLINES